MLVKMKDLGLPEPCKKTEGLVNKNKKILKSKKNMEARAMKSKKMILFLLFVSGL